MNAIAIEHKPTTRTNYTGVDEGAVPVKVYRKAQFMVAHVSEPVYDASWRNHFRHVKFVEVGSTELFTNTLFEGHYDRLAETLTDGKIVEIEYEVGTNWIRSINGKRWN